MSVWDEILKGINKVQVITPDGEESGGLYYALFGNKKVPVSVEIPTNTKIYIGAVVLTLSLAAIGTALILTRKS
jgi:hypothetical protein